MQDDGLTRWRHEHSFGQDRRRPGESRTQVVIAITATMMVIEIAAGALFGSMALLADGLHMASHAVALGINAYAYAYARRHARDAAYSFGTGKVNTLGGFTGAVLLAAFALLMAAESVQRLVSPIRIAFDQAIWVAVLGLIVNGASMLILGRHAHDDDDHGHSHDDHDHDHDNDHDHVHGAASHDHNLVSAYLHVLADALTSLLAIVALLAAKYFGLAWMDPMMGIVGAVLVARWSFGLLKTTSAVLLDRSAPEELRAALEGAIERVDGNRVVDLHLWCIGPNLYAAVLTVVTPRPRPPEHYKALIPSRLNIVHATVEVHAGEPR
ncbi:MAG TPA: CDF family Co(II)/Ni(II) efflux transporter DmeF [Gammaproteobacteria bacterium]|nr:CDF family Co(II)/Ni(II) efflux transporter DmeF [Gammaproteobacteria bacterium]